MRQTDDSITRVETSLPRDLHERFARIAHSHDRSMGAQLRVLVRQAVENNEAPGATPEGSEQAEATAAHAPAG